MLKRRIIGNLCQWLRLQQAPLNCRNLKVYLEKLENGVPVPFMGERCQQNSKQLSKNPERISLWATDHLTWISCSSWMSAYVKWGLGAPVYEIFQAEWTKMLQAVGYLQRKR